MTEKDFTLSDKVFSNFWIHTPKDTKMVRNVILAQDVKEFIRKLKKKRIYDKETKTWIVKLYDIYELAGPKLI